MSKQLFLISLITIVLFVLNNKSIDAGENGLILPKNLAFFDARSLEIFLEKLELFSTQKTNEHIWFSSAEMRLVIQEIQYWSNEIYERIENIDNRAKLIINLLIPVERYYDLSDNNSDPNLNPIEQNDLKQKYINKVTLIYKALRSIYMNNDEILNSDYDNNKSIEIENLIDSLTDSKGVQPITRELMDTALNNYHALLDRCNQIIENSYKSIEDDKKELISILNYINKGSVRILARKVFPKLRIIGNKPSERVLNDIKQAYKAILPTQQKHSKSKKSMQNRISYYKSY